MENCRDTRALTLMRGRNSEKNNKTNCTPRSVVYSVRTLFRYVSKDKLKVSGKSQLDLRALYRKPSDWCHGWKGERRKLQPIIFVCYLSMASQTWQELVEFHTTVWEIETTGWEIQEKCKHFENGRSKLSNRRKIRLFSQATTIYISYRCIFTRAWRLRVIKCRCFFFFVVNALLLRLRSMVLIRHCFVQEKWPTLARIGCINERNHLHMCTVLLLTKIVMECMFLWGG